MTASPGTLNVTAGDGTHLANSATTDLVATGYWSQPFPDVPPTLQFCIYTGPGMTPPVNCGVDETPPPMSGTLATGLTWAITNDVNPPTVEFKATQDAAPGQYQITAVGQISSWEELGNVTLNVAACQSLTCADFSENGAQCGTEDDGCGNTLDCGTCPSGQYCGYGTCSNCPVTTCPTGDYYDMSVCSCEPCPCGSVKVGGKWVCAVCKGP